VCPAAALPRSAAAHGAEDPGGDEQDDPAIASQNSDFTPNPTTAGTTHSTTTKPCEQLTKTEHVF
jgi:hypothetical protein